MGSRLTGCFKVQASGAPDKDSPRLLQHKLGLLSSGLSKEEHQVRRLAVEPRWKFLLLCSCTGCNPLGPLPQSPFTLILLHPQCVVVPHAVFNLVANVVALEAKRPAHVAH